MRISLIGDVLAPAEARGFVSNLLGSIELPSGVQHGDPVLVVSELVTNAVEAGASYIDVELLVDDGRVHLSVVDDARGWPTPQRSTPEDVNGRGLAIVERLAHQWEVASSETGKSVTATWLNRP